MTRRPLNGLFRRAVQCRDQSVVDRLLDRSHPNKLLVDRDFDPPDANMAMSNFQKVRQSWSKYNLFNLNRMQTPNTFYRSFFQQKWTAKSLARAYHGEQLPEKHWQRMFNPRIRSVIPMDPYKLAADDGSAMSAGRGSGLSDQKVSNPRPIPFSQMTFAPLERRLDVAIHRAMFASSTRQARQFVVHGAVTVNGQKMRYPSYLLNPGDLFQVDPERVMYATGAPKDKHERRESRVARKKAGKTPAEGEEAAAEESTEKKEADTEVENKKSEEEDPRETLKALLAQAKVIMGSNKEVIPAKRKQELRGFQKAIKRVLSRSESSTILADSLEDQFSQLTLLLKAKKAEAKESKDSKESKESKQEQSSNKAAAASDEATASEAKPTEALTEAFRQAAENPEGEVDTSELSEEEFDVLRRALVQMRDNPIDNSKPYATPWRPREYMSAFAYIPRYLEVNHNICAAVYLRHPVARPGFSEVPSPFGESVSTLAFTWYLRRRIIHTSSRRALRPPRRYISRTESSLFRDALSTPPIFPTPSLRRLTRPRSIDDVVVVAVYPRINDNTKIRSMYSWPSHSSHAASASAPGPAGNAGTTGSPGPTTGVGLGGGAGASAAGGPAAGTTGPGPGAGPGGPGGNPRIESPGSASSSSFQMPHLRWLPSMISRSSAATAPHTGHGQGSHAAHAGHTTLPTLSSNLRMGTPNATPQQHLPQQSPVHHPQAQIHPHAHVHANTHAHSHPHSHSHHHSHSHSHSQSQPQPHSQGRHTGVSAVVDARRGQQAQPQHHQHPQQHQQTESMESSDSEQSDGGHREGRGGSGADGSEEVEFMPSPGENTPSRRAGGRGRADDGHRINRHGADGMSATHPVLIDHSMGDEVGNGGGDDGADAGGGNDASRKHGKRLTTKEEVSLFDICNRHAEEFGQRSNLCNWWRTVTAEFTSEQGHPYSWHSVRRKVELVTKQRMKFLEDQREKGGSKADDMSNPRWRASVDAWIPTWQRWEDAEARRIEKRDSRRPRKRKDRSWESSGGWEAPTNSSNGGWRAASSPVVDHSRAFGQSQSSFLPPSSAQSPQVRLPPGFDNMFTSPVVSGASPAPKAAGSSMGNTSMPDNNIMSAMLETLGKLNKHLDTVNPDQQNASPLASSLAGSNQRNQNPRRESQQDSDGEESEPAALSVAAISKFKEELRQEMRQEIRSELEKDRAAFEERLDSVQRTQDMILEMLRQEPT
ncbi:mitochondrial 37S ribosomal uS4m domain-containing protein [Aspergillus affinis]|uniref:mitochondrial 37S ribosomal uS4m domain-containing protein n=1 Tax=Aspergillus affinis TaxID=1070780 RepID=UPI0022FE0E75|nr:putative 30S ribosomal subunit S4 [Aspergillus affinis]KAI9039055.1 putative 30S ribosomal subunit S4 [Aspergillus affinis]